MRPSGLPSRPLQRAGPRLTLTLTLTQVLASPSVARRWQPDALYACLVLCMALSGAATVPSPSPSPSPGPRPRPRPRPYPYPYPYS